MPSKSTRATRRRTARSTQRKRPPTAVRQWRALRRRLRRWRKWLGIALVLVVALAVAVKALRHDGERTRRRTTILSGHYNGIDVSKHQGAINWTRVAADNKIQFVYIKATEGATMVDSRYKRNLTQARAAGLKVGSYHFFTSAKSAREQFENFRRNVDRTKQDLIPMVDVELNGNRNATRAKLQPQLSEFMQLVKDEYGVYPLLYSQYGFYNKLLAPEFNRYFIFIARYGPRQPVLRGGGKYNIWQYTERGRVDGITGPVDLDRFANGTTLADITL